MNLLPVQCREVGCPGKADQGGRCPTHRVSRWAPSSDYGWSWRKVRDAYIAEHPTCEWPITERVHVETALERGRMSR